MEYLKKRVKSFITVFIFLLIGFFIAGLIFEKPDYKTAIFAILLGLIIGELVAFMNWRKREKEEISF